MIHMIDSATRLTPDTIKQFGQDGIRVFGRYVGPWWKCLTEREAKNIIAGGGRIVSVYESRPITPAYFNRNQGGYDAKIAREYANKVGQPITAPVFFPVDFEAGAANLHAIDEYFAGVMAIFGGEVGVYGSYEVVEYFATGAVHRPKWRWQTSAWSDGKISPHAHIYQYDEDTRLHGINMDRDNDYNTGVFWPEIAHTEPATNTTGGADVQYKDLPVLKVGQNNPHGAVVAAQAIVGASTDGSYGPITAGKVKEWQAAHGLTADGEIGANTWAKLFA